MTKGKIIEIKKIKFLINKETKYLEIPTSIETGLGWEPYETEIFEKILKKNMNVLDLGANIGWYSFIASRKVGPKGKIFAVEPDPFTYKKLLYHIKLNNFKNIIPIQKAAYDKEGTKKFYSYHFTVRDGKSGFYIRDFPYKPKITKVQTIRVDKLLENYDIKMDVIKMDVEGAEFKTLKGMKKTLKEASFLFTEVNAETFKKSRVTYEMFLNEIKKKRI